MELLRCPFCDKEIESDSFYCDQCGQELRICSYGHGFKKGKICTECGKPLTVAKDAASSVQTQNDQLQQSVDSNVPLHNSNPEISSGQVFVGQTVPDASESTVRPVAQPVEPKFLVNNALNARLQLLDGAVIGRRAGNYVHVFGSQNYVSGTHARLQRNGTGDWEIIDLDSTNGTFLNDVRLVSQCPTPFKTGDTIAFYDLRFIVE